jgi:acylphosphatase
MDRIRRHVHLSGLVQGVFFRASTAEQARMGHVDGWVRNLPGGDVEAVFEGREQDVERIIAWCHEGPAGARVDRVDVREEQLRDEAGFVVR